MGAITYAGRRAKRLIWLKRIVIALALYTIIGFFVVPAIIKSQMLKRLAALTHRAAAIEQVKFNPYALSLTIRGFSLKETNGDVFSSFDEFYANFQPIASLFKWSWVFSDISLKKPFAQITYRADGTFNFSNLLDTNSTPTTSAPTNTPAELPRVTIYSLSISNGAVAFADLNRKDTFRTEFSPIDLNLTNLTTIRDRNSPYSFIARTPSGETFAWSGTITVNPLASAGVFRLGALRIPKYSTYAHDYARYVIESGLLDVAAIYRYDSATNALDLTVSNAAIALTHLVLKSPDNGETNIAIPSFVISGTDASVARRTAHVRLVKSSGGMLLVRHETGGIINLLGLLNVPPAETPVTNAPPSAETPPWSARIDDIAVDNYTIVAQDKDLDHPANVTVDQLGFNIKGVSTASNAPVTASLSLRYAGTGTLGVNGTATLLPPSADLQITESNIDLRTIDPYVEQQAGLAITGGALTMSGRARYASPEPGAPLFSFTGDMAISNFATVDNVLFKGFAQWDALNVDGIKLQLQPTSLQIDTVQFLRLITSIVLGSNRQPTFVAVLNRPTGATNSAAAAPAPPPAATSAAPAELPPIAVGAVGFQDMSVHLIDDFNKPHVRMDIQQLSGTVSNLSSSDQTVATVNITGQVDERSPFTITGKMNPLATNHYMDIAVTFTNNELTPLSPYSEVYVGRPLSKGKLSFYVHTQIDHNLLKLDDSFFVDQLTLGAWNDSPAATHLPVKLAVALLKDRNGRISLDVPVSGRLDDPKFRVGPVIWQVVRNLLEKAATSPFSLLGAAFGGGDELSFVAFEPGRSDLPDSETNKLGILAKALFERPALTLEINGSVDTNADRLPLAHLRLEEQLKSLWAQEQQDAGKPAVSVEQVQLDPAERERLVRKIYKARFGPYQPSLVTTNQAGGVNPETARVAALLAALPPEARIEHGSSLLHGETAAQNKKTKENAAAKSAASAAASAAPAVPLTRAQLELQDMEAQLADKIEITSDDFRDLMQKRANQVQAYLLKTGKVDGGRLFVTAPKALDESFKGEDRANLTLD